MNPPVAPSPPVPMLDRPLPDLEAWVAWFRRAEIPVLADTADALEAMRANEDDVDANLIGEMVAHDPLMTVKILAHMATHRPERRVTDLETVTAAIVMMGISPFFGTFGAQPVIEDRLAPIGGALDGLHQVLRRAHRASRFAFAFAVHRMDLDAAVIHEAALLHDFTELLLWSHAPALALEIRRRQQDDPTLRSAAVQRDVLHITLAELQQALMKAWLLPELLIRISDARQAESHPSVKSVLLAIRIARHSADGWDNPALPDDLAETAQLLTLSIDATRDLLQKVDNF